MVSGNPRPYSIYIFRYTGFCFLYVYPVHQCVVFLVSCVLVLAVSPEKGSSLLPKFSVLF